MNENDVLESLALAAWQGPFPAETQSRAIDALEDGKLVLLPNLTFELTPEETTFLDPGTSGNARKNISFDPRTGDISNTALAEDKTPRLKAMMDRFGQSAERFLKDLLPPYAFDLERARTSFRPDEIEGRDYSPRHDDKRLHIDAFPSRPMGGKRILRVFTNVADDDALRYWRVGEPFSGFAKSFMPRIKSPIPGSAWLMDLTGITKGKRSTYDHFMLGLHDRAKLDAKYQATAPNVELRFAPGTTWMCFTDQVLHAALKGHAALEQTFYLPVEAMQQPEKSPLHVLEKITGKKLAYG